MSDRRSGEPRTRVARVKTPKNPAETAEEGGSSQKRAEEGRDGEGGSREEKEHGASGEEGSRPDSVVRDVLASKGGRGRQAVVWDAARRLTKVDERDLPPLAKALHEGMGLNSDWTETLEMLMQRIPKVKMPLEGDAADYLRRTLDEADAIELPRLPGVSSPVMDRLATWGFILKRKPFPKPFWLSHRDVAKYLGITRSRAETILGILVAKHVFEIAPEDQQGTQYEAMRFFYRGPEPSNGQSESACRATPHAEPHKKGGRAGDG